MVEMIRRDKDIQTNVVLTLDYNDILEAIKIYARTLLDEDGKASEFGFPKSTASEEVSVIKVSLEDNGELLSQMSATVTLSHSLPKREFPPQTPKDTIEAPREFLKTSMDGDQKEPIED
jgi:hypothetical protein